MSDARSPETDVGRAVRLRLSDEMSSIVFEWYERARKMPGGDALTFDVFMVSCLIMGVAGTVGLAARYPGEANAMVNILKSIGADAEMARKALSLPAHFAENVPDIMEDVSASALASMAIHDVTQVAAPKRSS